MNVRSEPKRERLACVATIASVNTFRLANVREPELHERSPDACERHMNVPRTSLSERSPDARDERRLNVPHTLVSERSSDARDERRLNVPHTLVSERSPEVRERSLSVIFLRTYLLTYLDTQPTDRFLYTRCSF